VHAGRLGRLKRRKLADAPPFDSKQPGDFRDSCRYSGYLAMSDNRVKIDESYKSRFLISVYIHVFLAWILFFIAVSRFFKIEQSPFVSAVGMALIASTVIYRITAPAKCFRAAAIIEIASVCAISLIVFRYLHDPSYDGPHNHLHATIALSHGWNPQSQTTENLWYDRYPYGIWTLRAGVFSLTSHVDMGRAVNVILAVLSFLSVDSDQELSWEGVSTALVAFGPIVTAEAVLGDFIPDNLRDAGRLTKFVHVIFSQTGGSVPAERSILKIPGTVKWTEIAFSTWSAGNGGFGPLFSLIFVLGVVTFVKSAVINRTPIRRDVFVVAAIAFLSVPIFPEPWVARFVPLWGLRFPCCYYAFETGPRKKY
jgi:hypothetical protein